MYYTMWYLHNVFHVTFKVHHGIWLFLTWYNEGSDWLYKTGIIICTCKT